MKEVRRQEIRQFINRRITSIMEFYIYGGAVDCQEARNNINKDLDSIFPETEKKFNLRRIPMVLRVRSDGDGFLLVRAENPYLT